MKKIILSLLLITLIAGGASATKFNSVTADKIGPMEALTVTVTTADITQSSALVVDIDDNCVRFIIDTC